MVSAPFIHFHFSNLPPTYRCLFSNTLDFILQTLLLSLFILFHPIEPLSDIAITVSALLAFVFFVEALIRRSTLMIAGYALIWIYLIVFVVIATVRVYENGEYSVYSCASPENIDHSNDDEISLVKLKNQKIPETLVDFHSDGLILIKAVEKDDIPIFLHILIPFWYVLIVINSFYNLKHTNYLLKEFGLNGFVSEIYGDREGKNFMKNISIHRSFHQGIVHHPHSLIPHHYSHQIFFTHDQFRRHHRVFDAIPLPHDRHLTEDNTRTMGHSNLSISDVFSERNSGGGDSSQEINNAQDKEGDGITSKNEFLEEDVFFEQKLVNIKTSEKGEKNCNKQEKGSSSIQTVHKSNEKTSTCSNTPNEHVVEMNSDYSSSTTTTLTSDYQTTTSFSSDSDNSYIDILPFLKIRHLLAAISRVYLIYTILLIFMLLVIGDKEKHCIGNEKIFILDEKNLAEISQSSRSNEIISIFDLEKMNIGPSSNKNWKKLLKDREDKEKKQNITVLRSFFLAIRSIAILVMFIDQFDNFSIRLLHLIVKSVDITVSICLIIFIKHWELKTTASLDILANGLMLLILLWDLQGIKRKLNLLEGKIEWRHVQIK